MKRTNLLYKLDRMLEDGLLRVGGRLSRVAMPDEAKHPATLARECHISDLIIRHIHQQTGSWPLPPCAFRATTKILYSWCQHRIYKDLI